MKANKKQAYTAVIVLAYCHRYVFLLALVLLAGVFGKEYVLLGMGIGAILYSLLPPRWTIRTGMAWMTRRMMNGFL